MDTPSIEEIQNMPQEDLAKLNKRIAKKLAINMMALVWVKITVPAVAQVCLKHALIRAAKNV